MTSTHKIVLMEGNPDITLAALYANREALPVMLARAIVNTPPDAPRQRVLAAEYSRLGPADRLRCHAEMLECRIAKRGAVVATLS